MKLSIIQNIALFFYKTIDKNGFLYISVKSLHSYLRWIFYIGLVLSLYLFLNFIGGLIHLENYAISANTVNLLNFLGILTIYLSTIYSSLIITYESIYNLNMQEVLIAKQERREFIKNNKLQWWRLRNMPFIFRALFYIVTYGFIYMILSFSAVAAMLDTTTLNAQNLNLFFQEFESMIQIYSLIYIVLAITFDYFVSKNRVIQKALK